MPFNLLLFPLAGAYYILVRFKYLKYIQYRLESQRILFNTILWGIFLLAISLLISSAVHYKFPETAHLLYSLLPFRQPYAGTAVLSLPLAVLGTEVINRFIKRQHAVIFAINHSGNELERLMKDAFIQSHLLQFTLDNGKFYIGWVKELPLPFVTQHIKIKPALSGYRDEKQELVFTTQYLSVYASYLADGEIDDISELQTDMALKADRIISVTYFDLEMYARFNPDK
ncbi:MAG: hypothetical protein ACKOW2_00810 [Sphingobacteriaceae bacterium]